jgi:acyl carrier protein
LIGSGLIDSLAILEIVLYLEETYGIDFSVRGIDREEFSSIGNILDLIERQMPEVN